MEEEKSAEAIIEQLKHIGDDGAGLLMIDSQLAASKVGKGAGAAE